MNSKIIARLGSLRAANNAAENTMLEHAPRFDALRTRHEDGTAPRPVSAYQLFQTPPEVAERMASLVDMTGLRVLEPSAGLGRLLDAIERRNPAEVVAVEFNTMVAGELFRQNRKCRLYQRDFLQCSGELGTFDAIVMNPPFHFRSDIQHILHAAQFLKPGGILVALCLDTKHREDALRPLASTWEAIPSGVFAKEGTKVATRLLTIHR